MPVDGVTPIELAEEQPGFVKTPLLESIVNRCRAYLNAGFPVHLTGAAGTGKTCLALYVAAQIGRPVVVVHGDEESGTSDLVGGNYGWRQRKVVDNFIHSVKKLDHSVASMWVDNRLTVACKYGFTLVYDEFTRSRAEANNALLSVLEEGILDMPAGRDGQSFLHVNPDFRAIFTSNPTEYAGVHQAADALQDRMITIKLDHYDRETEIAIAMAKSGIDRTQAERIVDVVRGVRAHQAEGKNGHGICPVTVRASIVIATMLKACDVKATARDENFVCLCHDVLDSPRLGAMPGRNLKDKVNRVIKEYAA